MSISASPSPSPSPTPSTSPASPPPTRSSGRSFSVWMFAGGLLQAAALFTPAVRVKLAGTKQFLELPKAGVAFAVLAGITLVVAFAPRRWWRVLPGLLCGVLAGGANWRIVHSPSGYFIDPLLRHAVHPAWGFALMY